MKRTFGAAIGILALGAASVASGQSPDSTQHDSTTRSLPPIMIVGSIRSAAGPSVGSGSGAVVRTLDRASVRAFAPRTLAHMLRRQGGVSSYDDLGSEYKLTLSSRGFFASPVVGAAQGLSVFLDGVRMNEADAAQVNFDLLPLAHVAGVEMLAGNGALLGRNSLGGALNLLAARGAGSPAGALELAAGSYGATSANAAFSGLTSGGIDYYSGLSMVHDDGWRAETGSTLQNVFVNVGRMRSSGGVRAHLLVARSRAETAGSLPESVFSTHPDSNLSAGDYEDLWHAQLAIMGFRRLDAGTLSFTTYLRRHAAERLNVNQEDDPDAFGIARNTTFGYSADYRRALLVRGATLSARVGLDGSFNRTIVRLFADSTKFGEARSQTTDARSPVRDVALFGTLDVVTGRVTWSGGARFDRVVVPFHDLGDPSLDATGRYSQLNPRFGVTVHLGRGASAFASWTRSFRAPSVIENACASPATPCPLPFALGDDPPLDAVRASTVEGGVSLSNARWSARVSAYDTRVRDDIFLVPSDDDRPGSTIAGYFVNLDRTQRRGVEGEVRLRPVSAMTLYANYARTSATFGSTAQLFSPLTHLDPAANVVTPGDRFPLVPRSMFNGGGDVALGSMLSLGINLRRMGARYVRGDEANEHPPLAPYTVTDARLQLSAGRWQVRLAATNVLAVRYASFGTYNVNEGSADDALERFLTPGERREFRVSVRRIFGGAQ